MKPKIAVCLAVVLTLFNLPVLASGSKLSPLHAQSIDRRVEELLSQMTLDEKVGQLNQMFYFKQFMKPEMVEPGIRDGKIVEGWNNFDFLKMHSQIQKIKIILSHLKWN